MRYFLLAMVFAAGLVAGPSDIQAQSGDLGCRPGEVVGDSPWGPVRCPPDEPSGSSPGSDDDPDDDCSCVPGWFSWLVDLVT